MASLSRRPTALLESYSTGPFARSFRFEGQEVTITADTPEQVPAALTRVEQAVARGCHAVGYVAYEAASGLNPALSTGEAAAGLPLVWFGIFRERIVCAPPGEEAAAPGGRISPPRLAVSRDDYSAVVERILQAIAAGDTYQVNYTVRQDFTVEGDSFGFYRRMCRNQQAPFCAWLDMGTHQILSASPELFFALQGERITMKPMKGTAARLPDAEADRLQAERLAASPKERAENLMIVDLIRNDLSVIAETGTVQVPELFAVEAFPTVHQMTSTVTATVRPDTGLTDIFRALFPCGSVTGAPKRRTMEIIRDLEASPRGVYCGAIGYVSPGGEAIFSVAIRTAVVKSVTGRGQMGVGSGITWDSNPEAEYRECLTKSAFLTRATSDFRLIESIRHDRDGYLLLERHLARLADSAEYFGFRCDRDDLVARLEDVGRTLVGPHKVRVLLAADGGVTVKAQPINGPLNLNLPPLQGESRSGDGVGSTPLTNRSLSGAEGAPPPPHLPLKGGGTQAQGIASAPETEGLTNVEPCRLAFSEQRVDASDQFLYHKTTRREMYERELRQHPDCYDVIFRNQRDEITEGSFNTVVLLLGQELLTPALACGLLPGVLRQELLETGEVREAVVTMQDLLAAEKIWLINSVRGWRECQIG